MKIICGYNVLAEPTTSFLSVDSLKKWGRISHNIHDDLFSYYISSSAEQAFRETGYPIGNYVLQTPYIDMKEVCRVASFPVAGVQVMSGSTTISGWTLDVVEGVSFITFDGTQTQSEFQVRFTSSMDEDKQTTIKRADAICAHYRNFGGVSEDLKPNPYAKYGQMDINF
jgi:hypothetical protein